jgi:hypothetical protein
VPVCARAWRSAADADGVAESAPAPGALEVSGAAVGETGGNPLFLLETWFCAIETAPSPVSPPALPPRRAASRAIARPALLPARTWRLHRAALQRGEPEHLAGAGRPRNCSMPRDLVQRRFDEMRDGYRFHHEKLPW